MWWAVLVVGFIVAVTPTMMLGVWNGASFLGLIVCLVAGGFIVRREYMDKWEG